MTRLRQFVLTCRRMMPLLALLLVPHAIAGEPKAHSVAVIINANSAISGKVAEYYARKRGIPESNLCVIRAPEQESVSREEYSRQIEEPVGKCLASRGLVEKVLYLVTTAGVPLRVRGKLGPDGDNAAVDSELTLLYSKLHGRQFPVNGTVENPLFNRPHAVFRHPDIPIYLVTRLAAYDLDGIRALVDRALAARNRGKFVIDARGASDQPGDEWLRTAAILLPSPRTIFDEQPDALQNLKDVIGYASWGSNDPRRKTRSPGFSWLPGAIVTEYVSTNARTFQRPPESWNIGDWKDKSTWFAGSPQSMIGDYIEEGVTGIAGHVDEPFLQLAPRPNLLLPAWHAGRTLAEAFYLSMPALSWQNIVIGDPLCSLGKP